MNRLFFSLDTHKRMSTNDMTLNLPFVVLPTVALKDRILPALNGVASVVQNLGKANCVLCGRPTHRQMFVKPVCEDCKKTGREPVLFWSPYMLCENDSVRCALDEIAFGAY